MKKTLKKLLVIMMIIILLTLPTIALADAGSATISATGDVEVVADASEGNLLILNYALQIAATLLITLIGVLGTWLTLQLGKNANLKNINDAQKELIRATKITIGELQQTMVSQLKDAHSDGKLTPQEIASLRKKMIDKTVEKLSGPAYALLAAASVDIEGLILGVGESWIERIKQQAAITDPTTA